MEAQMTTLSAAILLFLIMDPLGNIPIFLSLLKDVPPKRRRKVMIRELLIALGVLLGFLIGGQHILKVLQLRQESISIAGGIVLFLIGIRMVFPPADGGGIFGKPGRVSLSSCLWRSRGWPDPLLWQLCCCLPTRSRAAPRIGPLLC